MGGTPRRSAGRSVALAPLRRLLGRAPLRPLVLLGLLGLGLGLPGGVRLLLLVPLLRVLLSGLGEREEC